MTPQPPPERARKPRIAGLAAALAICALALAQGMRPVDAGTIAEWADAERQVSAESGSPFPGRWSTDRVPYLREIMECLTLSHPARRVTFMKSAQVGGSECGINLFGYTADRAPAPMLIVLPSIEEPQRYNRIKLQPAIDATAVLKQKVRENTSRDERGSTAGFKKFRGGFAQITGANSSAGLQMISARILVLEEISEYPFDVDGRGDPVDLALKRTTAWSGREKVFECSTPGISGMCRVTRSWEASDRRVYRVPCPQCQEMQTLDWGRLKWLKGAPDTAHYICMNGCIVEHHAKPAMLRGGQWHATQPGPGRHPGFSINQLYSPFVSWSDTVAAYEDALGDPAKEKVFRQQVLGLAWEERGDAPDHEKLMERRIPGLLRGRVPEGALFLTGGIDVQQNRVEWLVRGWGIGKRSWIIDAGIVPGDTAQDGVWAEMDRIVSRVYPSVTGDRAVECWGADTGYNTQQVYRFVRRMDARLGPMRVLALKGMGGATGHLAPAIGVPTKQDVSYEGRRVEGGVMLWPVGVWGLKSDLYANLRKVIEHDPRASDGQFPPGYVFLPDWLDEEWMKQVTAESLRPRAARGLIVHEWVKTKDRANEALDMMVYAAAVASHLGIDRIAPQRWLELAAERGHAPEAAQRELDLWARDLGRALPAHQAPPPAPVPGPAAAAVPEDAAARPSAAMASGAPPVPAAPAAGPATRRRVFSSSFMRH